MSDLVRVSNKVKLDDKERMRLALEAIQREKVTSISPMKTTMNDASLMDTRKVQ